MYTVVTIQQQIIEILGIDEKYKLVNTILYTVVTIQQQIIEILGIDEKYKLVNRIYVHCSNHTTTNNNNTRNSFYEKAKNSICNQI